MAMEQPSSTYQNTSREVVDLTPTQFWFFSEWYLKEPHLYIVPALFELNSDVKPILLDKALRHVVSSHDALQMVLEHRESTGHQFVIMDKFEGLIKVEIPECDNISEETVFFNTIDNLKRSLNFYGGTLIRAFFIDCKKNDTKYLLIVLHHLIADMLSLPIIIKDIILAYRQLDQGEKIMLPMRTSSIKQFVEEMKEYSRSTDIVQDFSYWMDLPWHKVSELPMAKDAKVEDELIEITSSLDRETTIKLMGTCKSSQMSINDLLVAALSQTFVNWTGNSVFLVDILNHGRNRVFKDVNLVRTVGWCVAHTPALIDFTNVKTTTEALNHVKDKVRLTTKHGMSFGILRYLHEDKNVAQQMRLLPKPEVLFLYNGVIPTRLDKDEETFLIKKIIACKSFTSANRPPRKLIFHASIKNNQLYLQLDSWYQTLPNDMLLQSFIDTIKYFISCI